MKLHPIVFCAFLALSLAACSSDTNSNNRSNNTNNGTDAGSDLDAGPTIICEAGEVRGCTEENTPGLEVCNSAGTAYEQSSCPSSPLSVCRSGECEEVFCIPNTRRCADPSTPERCNDEGTAFETLDACTGAGRCEEGNCLNRCELAELTNSYIGCEYWAVELENHLLSDSEEAPLDPENRPPFAIVLSNPSQTYDARVTVYETGGGPANVIPSRVVGTDTPLPGLDLVTLTSKVVGPQGQDLFNIEGAVESIVLPRGSTMTLLMPHKTIPFAQTTVTNTAYRVVSTQPVVAYQFNPLCCSYNYTNDASLLLPTSALTENYMFMSYAVFAGTEQARLAEPFAATMTVVATEPDTVVSVQLPPTKGAGRPYTDVLYPVTSGSITGPNANGQLSVTLQPHEVLNIGAKGQMPVEDMTGAVIRATKPVSVFGGHTCAFVPFNAPACDHLESQLFPIETWGTRFVASPLKLRKDPNDPMPPTREGTYWKFLAVEDGTVINTGIDLAPPNTLPPADEGVRPCTAFTDDAASGTFTLDAGQTCEFGTTTTFVAEAGKPIMVGAFLSGQNSVKEDAQFGDRAGDPAFFLVPPEEQFRTQYSFLTPSTYFQSYVTVVIRPGFNVTLDGQEIDLTLMDYEVVEEANIARAHIEVEPGPHLIEAQIPFGIVVYGYDDYVSYAFTGGLDLTKLNEFE